MVIDLGFEWGAMETVVVASIVLKQAPGQGKMDPRVSRRVSQPGLCTIGQVRERRNTSVMAKRVSQKGDSVNAS